MSKYRAEYLGRAGGRPQNYKYAIWQDTKKVAEFGHDFRNDERWLVVGGITKSIDIDLLSGGGREPLIVSESGIALLDSLLEG